jgi:uncharacterized membrane protein
MRSKLSVGLLGATIATAAMLCLSHFIPNEAHAAAITSSEQYRVVPLSSKEQLEQELNKLGAEGWKVRAGVASVVILAK